MKRTEIFLIQSWCDDNGKVSVIRERTYFSQAQVDKHIEPMKFYKDYRWWDTVSRFVLEGS